MFQKTNMTGLIKWLWISIFAQYAGVVKAIAQSNTCS
jgi:hypothetical protein